MRWALGLSYCGSRYRGWQSQPGGRTVQDHLQTALSSLAAAPIQTLCAGRTDAGVHALMQVVHFDSPVQRPAFSWVRGTNRHLPSDIAVQWARPVPAQFHARASATSRRYRYLLLESPARPGLHATRVGWVFRPLDGCAMQQACQVIVGRHDFSAFRAAECQAPSPVKTLLRAEVSRRGHLWVFDFEADAFLHHMVRNIMGCLIHIGQGKRPASWMAEVLHTRRREAAAPTFAPDGLYFVGPVYAQAWGLPCGEPAYDGWP